MSAKQPTFEEMLTKQASLEKEIMTMKTLVAGRKADDDKNDKEMEAAFKSAQQDVDKKDKEHMATHDDMEKVKDAFKKAQDEDDPEKKKEAMKKAVDMKKDHDSKYKGQDDHPKDEKNHKDMEAKIAETIMKKVPIINKILEATKLMDPANYEKVEKELTAATLEEVTAKLETIQPYIAVIGIPGKSNPSQMPGMVPFQASTAINKDNPTDIFEGSIDNIDFTKVKTSDLMGMYN